MNIAIVAMIIDIQDVLATMILAFSSLTGCHYFLLNKFSLKTPQTANRLRLSSTVDHPLN